MSALRNLRKVVVVGASLAGLRGVETLRRRGFDGRIVVIGEEPHRPYDRPPLSKEILRGDWEPERAFLRAADDDGVEWRLGARATALDGAGREVVLDSGERVGFDGLLIATGARPRALPGTPALDGIHTLRTLDDALTIRDALAKRPRVVVVGAGFIGAEVAASCRARDLDVTLLEALPVPLGRVLGTDLGELLARVHREHGVDVRCGTGVAGFDGDGRVERVRLDGGGAIDADLVVVGVGVTPNTEWLRSSGLALDDGVVCDETCATAMPGVVAAGDAARWRHAGLGAHVRVEHWTNAVEQGVAAAERLLAADDEAVPFAPVPFFWSDQYDRKLQLAGSTQGADVFRVVHGALDEPRFVALYGRAGKLCAVFGMNRPRHVMQLRSRIAAGMDFEEACASV